MAPALAAIALLGACTPADTPPAATASPAGASTEAVDLIALREQYGLPDCPETDLDAHAVEGGLPQTELGCLGSSRSVNLAGLPRVPTVINVWAQWCGPCREESPFLREASGELTEVSFLGINYNDPLPDWAIEFAGLAGWYYPHVVDQDKTLQLPLRIPGIPATYFVDETGRVAGVHAGAFESTEQVRQLVAQYLGTS